MIVYVQAKVQHLPRMSAAYGFMANPAGLSPQLSQLVPAGVALHPRHTLLPASPLAAHVTSMLLVSLQAHMCPSQFGLTPNSHEKHSVLRATPVLSLSNVCNTVAVNLECKSGPAWYQLFCKPVAQHQQASNDPVCTSSKQLCKVLLLMRTLCGLYFQHQPAPKSILAASISQLCLYAGAEHCSWRVKKKRSR